MPNIPKGLFNKEIAQAIYRNSRELVDALVKAGKILAKDANKEWARRAAKDLTKAGAKVPETIRRLLR